MLNRVKANSKFPCSSIIVSHSSGLHVSSKYLLSLSGISMKTGSHLVDLQVFVTL